MITHVRHVSELDVHNVPNYVTTLKFKRALRNKKTHSHVKRNQLRAPFNEVIKKGN